MAVDTPTKEYKFMLPIWTKIRVAAAGQAAVKKESHARDYLPCPGGYDDTWYNGMLHRAYWYGATGATEEIYQGSVFRKPPTLTPSLEDSPEDQQKILENFDNEGNGLFDFGTNVVNEIIKTSYGGILVDFDDTENEVLTQAQAKEAGKMARSIYYPAESIFYASKDCVRLYEDYKESEGEFDEDTEEQIKVLDIEKIQGENGRIIKRYRQRIYREVEEGGEKKAWIQYGDDIYPTWPGGEHLDFIPFQFIGSKNNDFKPDSPLLEGLVNANFQHYGLYSDYRNALHWIQPFPYATGYNPGEDQQEQVVRSDIWMNFPNPDTQVGILEFKGSGLETMRTALQDLINDMASMGAENLKARINSAESADKARIDKSSEASILATMVNNISSAITKSINIQMRWNGIPNTEYVYKLNTDFDPTLFDAQLLTALNKSNELGNLSKRSVVWNMKKGELLPDGISVEDEIEQIDSETSGLGNAEQLTEMVVNIVNSMKDSED